MTTTQITANILACYVSSQGPTVPQQVEIEIDFGTDEAAARDFAAKLPKSYGMDVSRCGHLDGSPATYRITNRRIILAANGVNGGVNETGVKRYRAIARKFDALGVALNFDLRNFYRPNELRAVNQYGTREAFEAAIA